MTTQRGRHPRAGGDLPELHCTAVFVDTVRMTSPRWAIAAAVIAAAACSSSTATGPGGPTTQPPPAACTFSNPIAFGADPWVVQHDGWYYMVQSRENGIWISRSRKLTQVD